MKRAAIGTSIHIESPGLWTLAWKRFRQDRVGLVSLNIVAFFVILMAASWTGLIASDWSKEVGVSNAPPTLLGPRVASTSAERAPPARSRASRIDDRSEERVVDPLADILADIRGERPTGSGGTPIVDPLADVLAEIRAESERASAAETRVSTLIFGGDKWGRDVLAKAIKGTETSLFVGLSAAALAALLGTLFGALAGYFGRWIDDFFNWFYSVFTSIPYLLLILSIAAVLNQKGTITVVLILGLTGWTGIFRLVRAEYMKHRVREYVQAADAIGASHLRRMFVHIFPNVSHVVLVQLSLHVVLFIKSEVVLSFLGFGVGVDTVSWGSMLNEAQTELILGYWWQLAAATTAMALLVTAFGLSTDAFRDALDPKLK
ncbi:MAG: peptide ABC transporter permease [Betaproteobacteria bacterium RIFCSPLOWO2_02_FULL_63_19]|nr:MAG: peptide ABC transporter permease [Betaproteobacteria bacterium RIFCSPLOWO2_02_FULL_63_19]